MLFISFLVALPMMTDHLNLHLADFIHTIFVQMHGQSYGESFASPAFVSYFEVVTTFPSSLLLVKIKSGMHCPVTGSDRIIVMLIEKESWQTG